MNAAVFLDRDNTIIHNDGDLGDPSQVRLIQGAASAIASLKGLNYRIIVVTNQGGVARGKYSEADVDRVNEKINELIRANSGVFIDRFYYCPYHPEGTVDRYRRDHPWRKPRPGMLLQAARDLGLDLRQSWMIGDQMRDVQAGFSAGVVPILLATDGATPPPATALPPGVSLAPEDRAAAAKMVAIEPVRDYFVVRSLIEAVRLVGQKSRPTNVTAAMKTERIEVISKPQVRSATAVFDASSVPVLETEREEKNAGFEKNTKTAKTNDLATAQVEAMERSLAAVNEVATEAAASRNEAAAAGKRKAKSEKSKPRGEAAEGVQEVVVAKGASTEQLVAEIESKAAEAIIAGETVEVGKSATAVIQEEVKPAAKPARPMVKRRSETQEETEPAAPAPTAEKAHEVQPKPANVVAEKSSAVTAASAVPQREPERLALSTTPTEPTSTPAPAEQTLRQILQELRSQRKVGGEFTYAGVMAIVLQMVAGVCLLAALLMGAGDNDLFFRWMSCALMLQLATLAMLLFRRT